VRTDARCYCVVWEEESVASECTLVLECLDAGIPNCSFLPPHMFTHRSQPASLTGAFNYKQASIFHLFSVIMNKWSGCFMDVDVSTWKYLWMAWGILMNWKHASSCLPPFSIKFYVNVRGCEFHYLFWIGKTPSDHSCHVIRLIFSLWFSFVLFHCLSPRSLRSPTSAAMKLYATQVIVGSISRTVKVTRLSHALLDLTKLSNSNHTCSSYKPAVDAPCLLFQNCFLLFMWCP